MFELSELANEDFYQLPARVPAEEGDGTVDDGGGLQCERVAGDAAGGASV
eukprot:COSAG05_NODE_26486_length_187_cov_125.363636_1_plen_49_part_10